VGLYAAFAHAVMQRRREIAIRLAVGAAPAGVRAMILREAALITVTGVALGAAGATAASRWAASLLFAVRAADPLVLGSAAILMLGVAVLATIVPAGIAARTAPSVLLRD